MRLYRSTRDPNHWLAFDAAAGWFTFPAQPDGWDKRRAARGVDPIDVREVPLRMAFNTGMPGTSMLGKAA